MDVAHARELIGKALAELKKTKYGWPKTGKPTGHMANVAALLGAAQDELAPASKPGIDLGQVVKGGTSVLAHDLTHETDGFNAFGSVWPAFDEMAKPGTPVLAPEQLRITQWGSAQGGESVHATGASGMRYWFGHVDRRKEVGSTIKRGSAFCKVSAEHPEPHVHVAIDGIPVLGHDFAHHKDYTHGASPIGAQLAAAGH